MSSKNKEALSIIADAYYAAKKAELIEQEIAEEKALERAFRSFLKTLQDTDAQAGLLGCANNREDCLIIKPWWERDNFSDKANHLYCDLASMLGDITKPSQSQLLTEKLEEAGYYIIFKHNYDREDSVCLYWSKYLRDKALEDMKRDE